jgi:hypothetical protein
MTEASVVQMFLLDAAELFKERNAVYKDNYVIVGKIYEILFPNGVVLKNQSDFNRMAMTMNMVNKLVRYAFNWAEGGHEDSLRDLCVFSMCQKHLDELARVEKMKREEIPF